MDHNKASNSAPSHQTIEDDAINVPSIVKLNNEYLEKIVVKIIKGKAPDELSDWIETAQKNFVFRRYSNEDLAFHWLTLQEKDWINKFMIVLSNMWHNSWLGTGRLNELIILRIKSLVENTKCGLAIPLLDKYLVEFEEKNLILAEINTYLLIAKIEEDRKELSLSHKRWSDLQDKIPYRSHLAVIYVFINRENPDRNISHILFELTHIVIVEPSVSKYILNEIETMFVSYMAQGVYLSLEDGDDRQYIAFKSSISQAVGRNKWLTKIINLTLDTPGLEDIKNRYTKIIESSNLSLSDQNEEVKAIEAKYL